MAKPKDQSLYDKVKKDIYKEIPTHSAYRSSHLVKRYKAEYEKKYKSKDAYEGRKKKDAPLKRWHREKWRSDTGEVGYTDKSSVYRPTVRISKDTPKTFSELSEEAIKKAKIEKAKTGRIRKFGDGWKPVFKKSTRKGKKYSVITPSGRTIHFGSSNMAQFRDSTGLGLYSHLDHNDETRRKRYLSRAKGIKNKKGELTWNDRETANYFSVHFLW